MSTLDNRGWQGELQKVSGLEFCQFPAESEIAIHGDREEVQITMKEQGLCRNMQTDCAAFEAWALALMVHCSVKSIRISQDEMTLLADDMHFQRFLYRVKRFKELFPDKIMIDGVPIGDAAALRDGLRRVLNRPRPRVPIDEEERARRIAAVSCCELSRTSEVTLEKALEISPEFSRWFGLEKVMRQWPVGLFREKVWGNAEARIFTGGKSAIDLIGVRDTTLMLFELKNGVNRKAGAISELLFYANVMRDALGGDGAFVFQSNGAIYNCPISPDDIVHCESIRAVLLAPRFHPLLQDPRIIVAVNEAVAKQGPRKSICFDVVKIVSLPTDHQDFCFTPISYR